MPKINELTRAQTLAATDLFAAENTSGTSTRGVSAQQIKDFATDDVSAEITDLKNAIGYKAADIGSYNRLNKNTVDSGKAISKAGGIVDASGWNLSDYIPVAPGMVLYASGNSNSNFAMFDAMFGVVSNSDNWANPFTVPNGVYYLKVSIHSSNLNTAYISTKNSYDDYKRIEEYLHDIHDIIGDDKRFEIVFQGVRNWGGARINDNNVVLVDEESKLYEKWYTKAAKIGLNSAETLDLSIYSSMCAANFVAGYVIYPDCSVHKCTLAYFSDKARNEGCIGKIDRDGNLSVDYSKIMRWMAHVSHNEKCLNCILYCVCKGGACPYSSNIIGNPINKSNHCSELYSLVMSKIRCLCLKGMIDIYSEDE